MDNRRSNLHIGLRSTTSRVEQQQGGGQVSGEEDAGTRSISTVTHE